MSNQGERICPLCTEEMDLTDRQLKPCKCGYEICVWCWHQIMDMAEKNETEGRCPACRTPYNKEKIVGTAADCERLVSETNVEKRAKSQKGKSKTEGRKKLASMRIIQRHIAYVIGMTLNLADEDLLQQREYFGQYGKVLKVSLSRTAAGAVQQFPNSTCSVYVTYSNGDEALRCIQSVHGFVLDGKALKACFGTTKYCHAWLRNAPCSNPDCVYLHEVASQEDSFTKDETMSDYIRDKLQQNTSSANSGQRRSGNVLPAPADVCCITDTGSMSSGIPPAKTDHNPAIGARVSPPISCGRSAALPARASWGTRASNNQHFPTSSPFSDEPPKTKPDTAYILVTSSNTVASLSQQPSLHHASGEKLVLENDCNDPLASSKEETLEQESKTAIWNDASDSSCASWIPATSLLSGQPRAKFSSMQLPNNDEIADTSLNSDKAGFDSCDTADENVKKLCSDISAMRMNENQHEENGESVCMHTSGEYGNIVELLDSPAVGSDFISLRAQAVLDDLWDVEEDLPSPESQRVSDPGVNSMPKFSNVFHLSGHPKINSSHSNDDDLISEDLYRKVVGRDSGFMYTPSNCPSRNQDHMSNMNGAVVNKVRCFNLFPTKDQKSPPGSYDGEMSFSGASNRGESRIRSKIFDVWNESNVDEFFGELANQLGFSRAPGPPPRIPNSNQSRFLFAREEESVSQGSSAFGQSDDYLGKVSMKEPFGFDFLSNNSFPVDARKDSSFTDCSDSDTFVGSSHSKTPSSKLSVPRLPTAAPPGFSVPSTRSPPPPPPGFAYHERTEQLLNNNIPGNHMLDNSYWSRGIQQQTPESGKVINDGNIDFSDPAILAVGRGMLPSGFNSAGVGISSQNSAQQYNSNAYEESRFQSLLSRSLALQQNQRWNNPLGGDHAIPSRATEQNFTRTVSSFSQPKNGINLNLNTCEYLRTERSGIHSFYDGYEDSNIQMPSSGNLFKRTYGI